MCEFSHSLMLTQCARYRRSWKTEAIREQKMANILDTAKAQFIQLFFSRNCCHSSVFALRKLKKEISQKVNHWSDLLVRFGNWLAEAARKKLPRMMMIQWYTHSVYFILIHYCTASNMWIYECRRIQWMCEDVNLLPCAIDGLFSIACDPLWFAFNISMRTWNEHETACKMNEKSIFSMCQRLTKAHTHFRRVCCTRSLS